MCERNHKAHPRVVVVGAGFGGLQVARALRGRPVDVLHLDRHNHHTFLPLLYEVASAGLEPGDIAQPVRAILRGAPNVRFRLVDVQGVDTDRRVVLTGDGDIPYDYLVLAAGSATNFFGVPGASRHAFGLKDLAGATAIRNTVLRNLERAEAEDDPAERDRLMTVAVIGGGPTGVELAGALAELRQHVLSRDHPDLDMSRARVVLLEALDHLLDAFPASLRRKARTQLEELGVEVRLGTPVAAVDERGVMLADRARIDAGAVVWLAGVRAESLAGRVGLDVGPGSRVRVTPTLQVPAHPEVFAIGDVAFVETSGGRGYPMLAPVAMQQGRLAAGNILRLTRGESARTFRYRDRGIMATIGRRRAVANVFGLRLSGFIAWAMWLTVHLVQLVGLRNRAFVLANWAWNYIRYDRAHRILEDAPAPPAPEVTPAEESPEDHTPVSSGSLG